jgi:G3E family GTPase
MAGITRIPILLLTGFLGSGKTTLLRSLLSGPDAANTAVIVNEFGEVGLDHHLLLGASETVVLLENGCVCCSVRNDLEGSLDELFALRLRREIPRFSRVVIETTGLAKPGGVVGVIAPSSFVAERFAWHSVLATTDATNGAATIDRYAEAFAQVTNADHIVVTKTDIASPDAVAVLEHRLRLLNPRAGILRAANGKLPLALNELAASPRSDAAWQHLRESDAAAPSPHAQEVTSCWFRLTTPSSRAAFSTALTRLVDKFGAHIPRAKGLLEFTDEPALSVVQYVSGSAPQIDAPSYAKDKNTHPGLVVFTAGIDSCDVVEILSDAGLEPGDASASAHDHAHHAHRG